jgi:indole-3-glycerol phosphate synthase
MLKEIVARKKERLVFVKGQFPEEELRVKAQGLAPTRPFIKAITKERQISLIAEIKKASPTRGVIRESFNHSDIAKIYQDAGVQAISVLTEEDYFQGSISFLNDVKSVTSVPILRKDFIFEPYQVYESRCFGADAILLIADILTQERICEFIQIATGLGMDCLVEVHTEKELKKVLKLK